MIVPLLTSCAPVSFNKLACPDVLEYSANIQNKAANEIEKNNIPTIIEFLKDYKVMRDQSKACFGELS